MSVVFPLVHYVIWSDTMYEILHIPYKPIVRGPPSNTWVLATKVVRPQAARGSGSSTIALEDGPDIASHW